MAARKRWTNVVIGVLVASPCLLGLLGVPLMRHRFSKVGNTLAAELAKAKAASIPTEAEDLEEMVATPAGGNAADDYRRAFGLLPGKLPKALSNSEYLAGTASAADIADVEKFLAGQKPTIALLTQATTKPGVNWGRNWKLGAALMFPEYSRLKDCAKLLAAAALSASAQGNILEAVRLLNVAFAVSHHIGQDPSLIADLVSYSVDLMASSATAQVLRSHPDSVTVDAVAKMMSSLPEVPNISRGFAGEMVLGRWTIRNIRSLDDIGSSGASPIDKVLVRDSSYRAAWEAKYVHYVLQACLASQEKDFKKLKAGVHDAELAVAADHSIENRLNEMMMPVYSSSTEVWARAVAGRQILKAAVIALRYRATNGRLPGATGVPDPFTGFSLALKKTPDGFKIYSVDSDLVDNGGMSSAERKGNSMTSHDLVRQFR